MSSSLAEDADRNDDNDINYYQIKRSSSLAEDADRNTLKEAEQYREACRPLSRRTRIEIVPMNRLCKPCMVVLSRGGRG